MPNITHWKMKYSPLTTDPLCEDGESYTSPSSSNTSRHCRRRHAKAFCASIGLNVIFIILIGLLSISHKLCTKRQTIDTVYSPASSVLRDKPRVFDSAFGVQTTPYQGRPATVNNQLWSDLYNFGISRISADEARPMLNKTLPIPDDTDHYIISLSVFHQLHCLNQVRKGLYGDVDWTDVSDHTGITHLDHCIDMIRQSLMCNADVTPLTWVRSTDGEAKEVAEVIHQCRDFGAIQEWAKKRTMQVAWNKSKIVTDDPLGWGDYHIDD